MAAIRMRSDQIAAWLESELGARPDPAELPDGGKPEIDDRVVWSRRQFTKHVMPLLELRGYDVVDCQGRGEVPEWLDREVGVDYVLVRGREERWLAARVQRATEFSTFTVRVETYGQPAELQRIERAIERGGPFPELMLHAYLDRDEQRLARVAVAKTVDVVERARRYCNAGDRLRVAGADRLVFVYWHELELVWQWPENVRASPHHAGTINQMRSS